MALHVASGVTILLTVVSGLMLTIIAGVRAAAGDGVKTMDDSVQGDMQGKIVWRSVRIHACSGFAANASLYIWFWLRELSLQSPLFRSPRWALRLATILWMSKLLLTCIIVATVDTWAARDWEEGSLNADTGIRWLLW